MEFNVVINIDDNYVQHCMAMLCSLFNNNKEHHIHVHVLTAKLSNDNTIMLNNLAKKYANDIFVYNVDESPLEGVQFRKERPLSKAAYYRLLLASILPGNINRILYLDCDMIVLGDVSELFELEIENYALAATLDTFPYSTLHRRQLHLSMNADVFCSGMMLVNLKYWRDNKVQDTLLEYARRRREVVFLHDQDVLNYAFQNKWFILPPKWNKYPTTNMPSTTLYCKAYDLDEYYNNPKIIHYADKLIKPWNDCPSPSKGLYQKYLKLSGYQDTLYIKVNNKIKFQSIKTIILLWIGRNIKRRFFAR